MSSFRVNHGEYLWQVVATAYRPSGSPWERYAPNTSIGKLSMATLQVNFLPEAGQLPLHNVTTLSYFPNGYQIRIPEPEYISDFPDGSSFSDVAKMIGYNHEDAYNPFAETRLAVDNDLPVWVEAYKQFLEEQKANFGEVVARNLPLRPMQRTNF